MGLGSCAWQLYLPNPVTNDHPCSNDALMHSVNRLLAHSPHDAHILDGGHYTLGLRVERTQAFVDV